MHNATHSQTKNYKKIYIFFLCIYFLMSLLPTSSPTPFFVVSVTTRMRLNRNIRRKKCIEIVLWRGHLCWEFSLFYYLFYFIFRNKVSIWVLLNRKKKEEICFISNRIEMFSKSFEMLRIFTKRHRGRIKWRFYNEYLRLMFLYHI